MMIGSSFGGYMGASCARNINEAYLRIAVTGFGSLLSAYYLWRLPLF
ncbi:MAG: hypothetical protein CBC34_020155 [Hyphomicrobiaceae bacterium TMED74]|nr:MAG: hypothetical protein CBC34_020155 [Hyphomicrobiaceae bacterium TMED74]